jgi:hypothetical protein
MKSKKTNIRFLLVIPAIIIVLVATFAAGCSKEDSTAEITDINSVDIAATQSEDNTVLDTYQVEIKDSRLTEDYEGNPVVVITYAFTNNSSESAAFWLAVEDTVYQNGEALERAFSLKDGDPYDRSKQDEDIQSGDTLDIEVAYILNNTETDLDVEAKVYVDFTHDTVSKTISIR